MTPGSREENADIEIQKKQTPDELLDAYNRVCREKGKLERDNQKLKDAVKEERFLWIATLVVIFDVFVFTLMENWGGPIAILMFQMVIMLILARKLGVEEIHSLIDKILESNQKRNK